MLQYCIYTQDSKYLTVCEFITQHSLSRELHLNRIRFWIDPCSTVYTEFALRFGSVCARVEESDEYF